jgi:hypothetical protein
MSITFRNPVTQQERALVRALETEAEIIMALSGQIDFEFVGATRMDAERINKTQRHELRASRIRYAALCTRIKHVLPVGHNSGVEPAEIAGDEINSVLTQFEARRDALVKAATDRTVTDNDEIGKAADIISMIRTLDETIWARAKEVAEPNSRAVETVKNRTARFVADLATSMSVLDQRIKDLRDVQRQRAQAQRDEQRQREAALRPDPEPVNPQIDSAPRRRRAVPVEQPEAPVSLAPVKGDYGSRVGDRALTTYVYADARKLPKAVLDAPAVEKAIQTALRAYVKLHKMPKGVTANADLTTTHRRPN